jgi:hypothetical protein
MEEILQLRDDEILKMFDTSYFLETSWCFIRCNKISCRTIEIINKKNMQVLRERYLKIAGKE